MALGATMLNVAVAGPALLVAGFSMKNRGRKAKTEAATVQTFVDREIAQIDVRDELLRGYRSARLSSIAS